MHRKYYRIKNVACDILRLRLVAIETFSAPPQRDPRGAFLLTRTISTKFPGKNEKTGTISSGLNSVAEKGFEPMTPRV